MIFLFDGSEVQAFPGTLNRMLRLERLFLFYLIISVGVRFGKIVGMEMLDSAAIRGDMFMWFRRGYVLLQIIGRADDVLYGQRKR